VVKAAGSEVKPLISPSSELGVSSGHGEEENGWGKKVKCEADVDCLHCAGLFSEDHHDEEWILCPISV
jgi:hypothetical protein